ncbi:AMP-binding protein, partial [Vallitalea sediminicola]
KDKEKNSSVPVGKPIINNRIYILDKYMKPVPIGCQGEIYIAGLGMTRGYMNDRELSSEKYIEDPFIKGEKMFRTGDHGLWLEDGNIIFINRKDRQVQVHGYR